LALRVGPDGRAEEAWRLVAGCGPFGDCGPRRVALRTTREVLRGARLALNNQLRTGADKGNPTV